MNFKRYFISIVVIFCVLSVSCFAVQNLKAVAVSGGENHTAVLADNNEVFACGSGFYGQLGNGYSGTTASRTSLARMLKGEMPTSTGFLEHITAISAGWTHSLILEPVAQIIFKPNHWIQIA